MGDVAIKMKVRPKDPNTDLEKVKQAIQEAVDPKDIQEKSIAFGLKELELMIVRSPENGDTDRIEKQIMEIDGVNSVETLDVTLL